MGQLVQVLQHQVAPSPIGPLKLLHRLLPEGQGRHRGVLRDDRRAGDQGVVHLEDFRHHIARGMEVAHPPAGHGVRLGQGENPHHPLPASLHLGRAEIGLARVDEVFVNLVGDDHQVVLLRQFHHSQRLRPRIDRAGGIVGIAVEDGGRAGVDLFRDGLHVQVEIALLVQRDEARFAARQPDRLLIGGVAGRGQDHLLAPLGGRDQGRGNRLDGACRDQDLPVRVVAHPLGQQRFGHQLAQFGQPVRKRVLGGQPLVQLFLHVLLDHLGGVKAGNALGQGDRPRHPGRRQFHLLDRRKLNTAFPLQNHRGQSSSAKSRPVVQGPVDESFLECPVGTRPVLGF